MSTVENAPVPSEIKIFESFPLIDQELLNERVTSTCYAIQHFMQDELLEKEGIPRPGAKKEEEEEDENEIDPVDAAFDLIEANLWVLASSATLSMNLAGEQCENALRLIGKIEKPKEEKEPQKQKKRGGKGRGGHREKQNKSETNTPKERTRNTQKAVALPIEPTSNTTNGHEEEQKAPSTRHRKKDEEKKTPKTGRKRQSTRISKAIKAKAKEKDEELYCICNRGSFGDMVGCDNDSCKIEWYHFECIGLKAKPKGKWYCPDCRAPDNPRLPKSSLRK